MLALLGAFVVRDKLMKLKAPVLIHLILLTLLDTFCLAISLPGSTSRSLPFCSAPSRPFSTSKSLWMRIGFQSTDIGDSTRGCTARCKASTKPKRQPNTAKSRFVCHHCLFSRVFLRFCLLEKFSLDTIICILSRLWVCVGSCLSVVHVGFHNELLY